MSANSAANHASVGVRLGTAYHRALSIMAARRGASIKTLIEEVLWGTAEVKATAQAEGIELPAPKSEEAAV